MARSRGAVLPRLHEVRPRGRARPLPLPRSPWRSLGVLVLLCFAVLFHVWQHVQVLRFGYSLEALRAERASLLQEQKLLTLEVARLTALSRVEAVARARFAMETPHPGQVIVLPEPMGPRAGPRR